jgi:single-stranded-DNA-specific exonuclease
VAVRSRWIPPRATDPAIVAELERELHVATPVCRLLAARGFIDPERAKRFLRPRFDHVASLGDRGGLADLDRAVDRLTRAARNGETVLVHGDYDVDGMC